MKRICLYIIAFTLAITSISCQGGKSEKAQKQQLSDRQELEQLYHIADSIYYKCGRIDTAAFGKFINKATAFVEQYPQDTIAPAMLYRAGIGSMILAKAADGQVQTAHYCKKAIAIFDQFQKSYPNHPQADYCFYQRGIIYDDILGDWNSAEVEYKDFINRHKEDSLAIQLSEYIKLLGKSEDEIYQNITGK